MNPYDSSDDQQPVMWFKGYPVYAAYMVVLIFVVSMFVTTLLNVFGSVPVLGWLPYSSELVLRGQVWRIFTYGLLNPPSVLFVVDMYMMAVFGRELEKFFGRRTFLLFYVGLYLLSPLLFTVIGHWHPMFLAGETGSFALFVAFAALYPNAVMLFNLLAKWVAAILVGIYALIDLSERNWVSLLSLLVTVGFAYAFVRMAQGRFSLPTLSITRPKPRLRVLPDITVKSSLTPRTSRDKTMAEIDAVLDKIATSGIHSLTAQERATLERGRKK